jgi:hypothetical protein
MRSLPTLLLLATLTACGSETTAAAPDSGISGRVLLGPTCPVETVDEPCPDQPASGVEVQVKKPQADSQGSVVARATTDEDGRFRLAVAPGRYEITAEAGMFCKPMEVEVPEADFVSIVVACDTGIR